MNKLKTFFISFICVVLVLVVLFSCLYSFNNNFKNWFNNTFKIEKSVEDKAASASSVDTRVVIDELEAKLLVAEDKIDELNKKLDEAILSDSINIETLKIQVDEMSKEIKDIKYQIEVLKSNLTNISNSNLLLNGNFQVNQRGASYGSNISSFLLDRWVIHAPTNDISYSYNNDKSLTINNNSSSTTAYFYQTLEFPENYSGKVLTMSVNISSYSGNPDIYIYDGDSNHTTITSIGIIAQTKTITSNCLDLRASISIPAGSSITINWVKLEYGSMNTEFNPRIYVEELQLCQRYFVVLKGTESGNCRLGFGMVTSSNSSGTEYDIPLNLNMEMRALPIASYTGLKITGTDYWDDVISLTVKNSVTTGLSLIAKTSYRSSVSGGDTALLYLVDGNGYLQFDAEI